MPAGEPQDSPQEPLEAPESAPAPETAQVEPKKNPWPRLAAVGLLVVGLIAVAHLTGLSEREPAELISELRELMASWGAWGVLVFVVVFLIGELLQVPGLVFVSAAVLSYGQLGGGVLAYCTGVLSVVFSFFVVRGLGGAALGEIDKPWVKTVLKRLNGRPITTVAVLRIVLLLSPPLNYMLALSTIRFRDYLIGSAIGLFPPIAVFVILFDQLMRWLGWVV
jgi:uncharacterized membrane protein YdjX (TVP38/TMEM64 family)